MIDEWVADGADVRLVFSRVVRYAYYNSKEGHHAMQEAGVH